MDPIEFLDLAEELVERRTPCACRTAIGRAYYGALNVAGKLLREAGFSIPENQNSHQLTWQHFINSGIEELELAGSDLSTLQGRRNEADYKMQNTVPERYQNAKFQVTEAREHMETIRRHFDLPIRAATVAGIAEYRKKRGLG
jgi:hypothetical protein